MLQRSFRCEYPFRILWSSLEKIAEVNTPFRGTFQKPDQSDALALGQSLTVVFITAASSSSAGHKFLTISTFQALTNQQASNKNKVLFVKRLDLFPGGKLLGLFTVPLAHSKRFKLHHVPSCIDNEFGNITIHIEPVVGFL